jgi:serine/threonine-protein kinase RsbW
MLSKEISMESRLGLIPATVEELRSDPRVRSCLEGRELDFYVAVSEALTNAVTHGNRNDPSRKVYVRYTCEPGDGLSILIRDEGSGFNSWHVPVPKGIQEDRNLGIWLMRSCMDEVQFRSKGTEVYMRLNSRLRSVYE